MTTTRVRLSCSAWVLVALCVMAEGDLAERKVQTRLVFRVILRKRLSGSAECSSGLHVHGSVSLHLPASLQPMCTQRLLSAVQASYILDVLLKSWKCSKLSRIFLQIVCFVPGIKHVKNDSLWFTHDTRGKMCFWNGEQFVRLRSALRPYTAYSCCLLPWFALEMSDR